MLGRHVPLVVTPISILGHYKEGRILALGVTSRPRLATLPEVPTVAEILKIPSFNFQTWFSLVAPAKTPALVLQRLQQAVAQVAAQPEFKKRLGDMGLEPDPDSSSAGLAALMKSFAQTSGALIEGAGIQPEI